MLDASGSGPRRIKSVDQAFRVVEYVDGTEGVTLSTVANDLDVPVSTAHIYLTTLVENGYLLKEGDEYRCSFKFLNIGGRKRDQLALFQVAKDEVDDLQVATGEHTNIMTEENGYAVQLYKSRGPETIDDDAPVGKYFPLHVVATGKAMLAALPEATVESIVDARGLAAQTSNSITDDEALRAELDEIGERGYSINREEHYRGVAAVGTAITSDDDVLGAISVSGPVGRMEADRIEEELAPALLTKKNVIELKIRQRT